MAGSMFYFIKNLTPNFHNITPKNDGLFQGQFHSTNLAFEMPKWATKRLNLSSCSSKFVAKKVAF